MSLEVVSKVKCFHGFQFVYRHLSKELNCPMKFSLFVPIIDPSSHEKFHTLFYLSGLTCTEENFIQKSGFQKYASEHKLMVVGPDTSPRGIDIPGQSDSWEFGQSAGWYLDATEEPWKSNYRMYSYVTKELPELVQSSFPTTGTFGIFGHSMGGHGAIVCGLRNPEIFKSISAFAPASNPSQSPWGKEKAFKNFLGEHNREKWNIYDSCELIKEYGGPTRNILVDQGAADDFLESNLLPQNLKAAAEQNPSKIQLNLRLQEGYNHSYFFVSTFIGDHFAHHAKILKE
jgi:S-formylglutathione hydrolase